MSASGNGSDDETTPTTISQPIKFRENRELAMVIADLVFEARAHTVGLRVLYEEVCALEHIVPKSWGGKLIEAYERHEERTRQQIIILKTVIA